MKIKSIRSQLLIYMGVFVMLPMCFALLILNVYLQRVNTANKRNSDISTISQIKDNADQMIEVSNYATSMMMTNQEVINDLRELELNSNSYKTYLSKENLSNKISEIESSVLNAVGGKLALLTNNGYLIGTNNISKTVLFYDEESWFQTIKENGRKTTFCNEIESFFQEMRITTSKKSTYIYMGRGIYDYSGKYLGMLMIQLSDAKIWGKYLENLMLEGEGALYIVSEKNEILMEHNGKYEEDLSKLKMERKQVISGEEVHEGTSDNHNYYISVPLNDSLNQLIYVSPKEIHFRENVRITIQMVSIVLMVILFTCFTMLYVSGKTANPLIQVTEELKKRQEEIFKLVKPRGTFAEIDRFIDSYNSKIDRIEGLFEQVKEESRLKEKARYEMLMSQISPHFIFNTVNSIKIMTAERDTKNLLEDLGDILHAVYDNKEGMTTIGHEVSVLKSYVDIMRIRFGNSFVYYNMISTSLFFYDIPAFTLQPIVENAILHGVKNVKAGQIIVSAIEYEKDFVISIFNNGNSAKKEEIERLLREPSNEKSLTGIGLYNVNSRLKMLYGESYGLIYNEQVKSGFEIWIRIPKRVTREM
ncbi:two-component system sensor histidine kinase YesM [Lachnospiraceae bacterium PF1-21]|uniref:sensor histidine kinase n=1 Tax=Ohessyouella blattaphilus TaxID=2949333 RepID=UPI003E2F0728